MAIHRFKCSKDLNDAIIEFAQTHKFDLKDNLIEQFDGWLETKTMIELIQKEEEYLKSNEVRSVVVYCSGDKPRNNIGHWDTKKVDTSYKPGTRQFFTVKDKAMAADCDYGFMIWDGSSTGTLSNAIELVERNKIAVVYISKTKQFFNIKNVQDIEKLIKFMSETSLEKADNKIGLFKKIETIKSIQHDIFDIQPIEANTQIKQPNLTQHSIGTSLSLDR